MDTNKDKKQFSTNEVAKLLGVSRVAVFNKIKAGEIHAQKVGRNYVINRESLSEYLELDELPLEIKKKVDTAVKRATKEYGEVFKMLGKE